MISHVTSRATVLEDAGRAILYVLRQQKTCCADDVRKIITIPENVDPRVVGVAFREAARDGLIERVGTVATTRPKGGCHLMYVWRRAKPPISKGGAE
jgi:hypothetical protein